MSQSAPNGEAIFQSRVPEGKAANPATQRVVKPYGSKDVIRLLERGRYSMEQLQKMCHYLFSCDPCLQTYSMSIGPCSIHSRCLHQLLRGKLLTLQDSYKAHQLAMTIERVISCSERFDTRSQDPLCKASG